VVGWVTCKILNIWPLGIDHQSASPRARRGALPRPSRKLLTSLLRPKGRTSSERDQLNGVLLVVRDAEKSLQKETFNLTSPRNLAPDLSFDSVAMTARQITEQEGTRIPPTKVYADKFTGQVVVVTGSAQGIGEVTASLFAAQGASVVLVDMNEMKVKDVASSFEANGWTATSRVCNLTVEEQVTSTINEIASTLGKIDVLVHLAGIYPFRRLLDSTLSDYDQIMSTNMASCFFLTHATLPHMQKAGYGRIINTASGVTSHPEPGLALYAAAKSAVAGFTRATAVEAGPGVTANVVSPSLILTDRTWNSEGSKALFDIVMEKQCVKRYGLPRDIAHTISFIASPEADFITGQLFDVGGGATFN
jgi:NAD(P)-dependent dehydrogenase (short-subunit alcohol dehydrogenase family)